MRAYCILGCVLLLIDALTKFFVVSMIAPLSLYAYYPFGGWGLFSIDGFLSASINLLFNKGAAFGLFSDHFVYVLGLRAILVIALVFSFVKTEARSKRLGFLFVIVGAIGNLIDHLWYEGSVDMIHMRFFDAYTFPLFNFADMLIFFGVVILLCVKETKPIQEHRPTLVEALERARNR